MLVLALVLALYVAIFLGSITKLWGIDYTLDLSHYGRMFAAGLTAILDTTFLSALATPIAGIAGMVIAYLVVRKTFTGKEALDFTSNLGGAVPGTILGIGYIIAFIQAPMPVVILVYVLLAYYVIAPSARSFIARAIILLAGTLLGMGVLWLNLNEKGRQPLLANGWLKPLASLPVLDLQSWLMLLGAVWSCWRWQSIPS
jgi:iron(III) transport system permease protein